MSCRYSSRMSDSRVGKWRYRVPMPTPAFLAIALSDVLPEAASASLAAARIRSRLLTASLRVGFWGVEFTSVKYPVL